MGRWGIFFSTDWLPVTVKKNQTKNKRAGGKTKLPPLFFEHNFCYLPNPFGYRLSIDSSCWELSRTPLLDCWLVVVARENKKMRRRQTRLCLPVPATGDHVDYQVIIRICGKWRSHLFTWFLFDNIKYPERKLSWEWKECLNSYPILTKENAQP